MYDSTPEDDDQGKSFAGFALGDREVYVADLPGVSIDLLRYWLDEYWHHIFARAGYELKEGGWTSYIQRSRDEGDVHPECRIGYGNRMVITDDSTASYEREYRNTYEARYSIRFGERRSHLLGYVRILHLRDDEVRIAFFDLTKSMFQVALTEWLEVVFAPAKVRPELRSAANGFSSAGEPRRLARGPYGDKQEKATLVQFLVTECGLTQIEALGFVPGVSKGTLRKYRNSNQLLSPEEYEQSTGMSLPEAANELIGQFH